MHLLEGKVAFVKNRVHGTSSRYQLTTTNHHGHGFFIGKLATVSFSSYISMCVYDRRKCLCYKENQQSLAFLDLLPCSYFKIEHMAQDQGISQQLPITMPEFFYWDYQLSFQHKHVFLCQKESYQSLDFLDLVPCTYFKIEHMA